MSSPAARPAVWLLYLSILLPREHGATTGPDPAGEASVLPVVERDDCALPSYNGSLLTQQQFDTQIRWKQAALLTDLVDDWPAFRNWVPMEVGADTPQSALIDSQSSPGRSCSWCPSHCLDQSSPRPFVPFQAAAERLGSLWIKSQQAKIGAGRHDPVATFTFGKFWNYTLEAERGGRRSQAMRAGLFQRLFDFIQEERTFAAIRDDFWAPPLLAGTCAGVPLTL